MQFSFPSSKNDDSNNIKDYKDQNDSSKYLNLTNEEITEKINDNKKKIIEYHNINKSLKNELTGILEKLNSFSIKDKNQLNSRENNLQEKLNNRKMEYIKNKMNNLMLKDEYNILLTRMKEISEKNLSNLISDKRLYIEKLKEENFGIKKEIIKNQSETAKTQNEVIRIRNNNLHLKSLDLYSYKLKKYLDEKNKYFKYFNMNIRLLKDKLKEINTLESIIKIKDKIYSKNEIVFNKLKEDLNKIKNELSEAIDEIDKKNINEDILIINNIIQKNEDSTNANTSNLNITNNNINIINRASPEIFITKSSSLKNIHHKKICNYNKIRNSTIKLKPILNKNNSLSLLHNNALNNSKDDSNSFSSNLKQIYINDKTSSTLNTVEKREKLFQKKNINCFSFDFSKLKYKDMDDEIYHNLLNKKDNYKEESERISQNIKELNKAFLIKYNKVLINLKQNIDKLNDIKIINNGLQTEIKKLQDLMSEIQDESKKNNIENRNSFKNE